MEYLRVAPSISHNQWVQQSPVQFQRDSIPPTEATVIDAASGYTGFDSKLAILGWSYYESRPCLALLWSEVPWDSRCVLRLFLRCQDNLLYEFSVKARATADAYPDVITKDVAAVQVKEPVGEPELYMTTKTRGEHARKGSQQCCGKACKGTPERYATGSRTRNSWAGRTRSMTCAKPHS